MYYILLYTIDILKYIIVFVRGESLSLSEKEPIRAIDKSQVNQVSPINRNKYLETPFYIIAPNSAAFAPLLYSNTYLFLHSETIEAIEQLLILRIQKNVPDAVSLMSTPLITH